ncbi:MAG: hypothetical protein HUJ55_01630 [Ileibacterium sp.]|nr:hypothetical protein [Ileibacterium sp.]
MAKTGAVRSILKNKDNFQFDLRSSEKDGSRTTNVYDVFYENSNGTFTIAFDEENIYVAALNFSMGKIMSLTNDANMKKLAQYVLDHTN